MKVTKAVIPAAGLGTRLLPATRAVPKNLLPVVDRPIIQYAVEELVRAGVEEIWLVISKGQESLSEHFRPSHELESALEARGKSDLLEEMHRIQRLASIDYLYQEEPLGLGHAVGCAADKIGNESFAALLPDELFDPAENFLAEMMKVHSDTGDSVVAVHEVPGDDIRFYGAIDPVDETKAIIDVKGVVEKPDPAKTPSHLSMSGRYVLSPDVFGVLEDLPPGAGNEIQLADALGVLAQRGSVKAMRYEGRRWDVGKIEGLLQANVSLAMERPDLGPRFKEFLNNRRP
jgi:UTP--glucose-1-phosphate uridylyltransferase